MPFINFRNLPTSAGGLSKLFNDYLYDFPKVKQFYPSDFHALENIRPHFEKTQKSAQHRSVLVEILKEQNTSFGCGEKSLKNVELLRDEKTFCVVTGQQVGILGGPLYTFYKSATAVKLSERLKKTYPEFNFVPVFWLEGEDHDFAEANNVTLLTQENVPVKIEYLIDGKPLEKNIGPVGEIVFDDSLASFLLQVGNALPNSEFHSPLLTLLGTSYGKNRSFNTAFARWLWTISKNGEGSGNGDSGLVFI